MENNKRLAVRALGERVTVKHLNHLKLQLLLRVVRVRALYGFSDLEIIHNLRISLFLRVMSLGDAMESLGDRHRRSLSGLFEFTLFAAALGSARFAVLMLTHMQVVTGRALPEVGAGELHLELNLSGLQTPSR